MLLDDIERTPRERTDAVIHLLGPLPAATLQLTTELRAVVHPLGHSRVCSLSGLTMRAAGQQHVVEVEAASRTIRVVRSDQEQSSGSNLTRVPMRDGREIGGEISEQTHGSPAI